MDRRRPPLPVSRPDRRQLMSLLLGGAAAAVIGSRPAAASPRPRPAAIDRGRVLEFVRAAHTDLEATRGMLEAEPALVNATWDWGGGDFETALGGASHMGSAEIARHLLAHGARLDLFAAAMLGELAVVRAALAVDPGRLRTPGPHGIPLVAHAEAGGEPAREVLDHLRSLGA